MSVGQSTPRESAGTLAAGDIASLLAWYHVSRRRLPWREDANPYTVWVSEVMLQQTRVETVIPYYRRFLKRFPTIRDLAHASLDEVLALWSGLGYYRRARALHAGARAVIETHSGRFPRDFDQALSVPGIGPYTAGAIISIAYNLPVPAVDGNVERVLCRFLRIEENPRSVRVSGELRRIAQAAIPEGRASDFNQALMELGATVCTPASPACGRCPIAPACLARRAGDMRRYPRLAPSRTTVAVALEAAVVRRGDLILLERCRNRTFLDGLWLFPFVELSGTAPARRRGDSTVRPSEELMNRLGRILGLAGVGGPLGAKGRLLGEIRHAITYRRIHLRAFLFELDGIALEPDPDKENEGLRWVHPSHMCRTIAVSSMALKIARLLKSDATHEPGNSTRRSGLSMPSGSQPSLIHRSTASKTASTIRSRRRRRSSSLDR